MRLKRSLGISNNFLNIYEFAVWALFLFCYAAYFLYIRAEVPTQTWYDFIPLVDKLYTGTLKWQDIVFLYGEHGMLGYSLLFLFNAVVFHLQVRFEVWLNILIVLCGSLIMLWRIKQSIEERKSVLYMFVVFLVACLCFNLMQGTPTGMDTQVRLGLLFNIITASMVSHALTHDVSRKYMVGLVLVTVLGIAVFGTLYSFAGVGAILLLVGVRCIATRKINKTAWIILITNVLCIFFYVFEYRLWSARLAIANAMDTAPLAIFNPLRVLRSFFVYNASGFLGYSAQADNIVSAWPYTILGILVTLIYFAAILLFFIKKMYQKTYLPLLFFTYSFAVFAMVALSRSVNWSWMLNGWYHAHTKPAAVACIWIFGYAILHKNTPAAIQKEAVPAANAKTGLVKKCQAFFLSSQKQIGIISGVFCIFLLGLTLVGTSATLMRIKYTHAYLTDKQPYLFVSPENMPVNEDGYTPLTHTLSVTNEGIAILKKYDLSVFRYYSAYQAAKDWERTGKVDWYGDGWIGPGFEYTFLAESQGKVTFHIYYPGTITGQQTGTIYLNDVAHPFTLEKKAQAFTFDVPPDTEIHSAIRCDFIFESDGADSRKLCFVLSNIEIE
ncbi:MAG: hypothetical protein AB7V55_01285 [Oscillospiraceae bacterium]